MAQSEAAPASGHSGEAAEAGCAGCYEANAEYSTNFIGLTSNCGPDKPCPVAEAEAGLTRPLSGLALVSAPI